MPKITFMGVGSRMPESIGRLHGTPALRESEMLCMTSIYRLRILKSY